MQSFTFSHEQIEPGLPVDHVTIKMEAGAISMDELLTKFAEFLRACGYVVPYDSQIEIVPLDVPDAGCQGECDTCTCE